MSKVPPSFTLLALHNNGRMEPVDVEQLIEELTRPDEAPAWVVLGGLMDRLEGCDDPQVQSAIGWVEGQLAEASAIHRSRQPEQQTQSARQFPQPVLTAFGLCFLVGAWTVLSWFWRLTQRII